jgi:hypothetical protein
MLLDLDAIFDPDRRISPVRDTVEHSAKWHTLCDERAAIMEYDGGLPREQAERLAKLDLKAVH